MKYFQAIVILFLIAYSSPVFSQHVFSEKDFEYKKSLLPYELSYIIPLADKQFILLSEEKKNLMKLGRYDEYFFELWEKDVEFDSEKNAPQIILKGDTLVAYCYTINDKGDSLNLSFRYFDIDSGDEFSQDNLSFFVGENHQPGVSFSEDNSKFVVQNTSSQSGLLEYHVFNLGAKKPIKINKLPAEALEGSSMSMIHLDDSGDLLMVSVDASNFKTNVYFWSAKNDDLNQVESNFFLERPAQSIDNIEIIRQGASSYFITFSAKIEDELIGFSVLGVNVILKNVLFSHNQNFTSEEIAGLYQNYYLTSDKQKKKRLQTPEILEDFRLVKSCRTPGNEIILIFEELEIPVDFHQAKTSSNMTWKHKSNEDKFYFGGDLLIYCFDETGLIKWRKTIQKTQFSQANSLGLSFIPRILNGQLDLLMYESSKDGNFYILSINPNDGKMTRKINLLPDSKFEFVKKYSCWLSENAVILLGVAPANINKRTLMLVEF